MKKIATLNDFSKLKDKGSGYVLITDTVKGNLVHLARCEHVKTESFLKKVIEENCRTGNYYFADDIDALVHGCAASFCEDCLK